MILSKLIPWEELEATYAPPHEPDAQQEIRALCDLIWPHLLALTPEFAEWHEKSRLHRARLAP